MSKHATQERIEQEARSAGFTSFREAQHPHRILWRIRCSIPDCVEYHDRLWPLGQPPQVLIKAINNLGWHVDIARKPRCPAHARAKVAQVTGKAQPEAPLSMAHVALIAENPSTAMGAKLAPALLASAAPAPANQTKPQTTVLQAVIVKPDPPKPPEAPVAPSKEPAVTSRKVQHRTTTRDMKVAHDLIAAFGGSQGKAGEAIGMSSGYFSRALADNLWTVTARMAAMYVLSTREKKGEATLVIKSSAEMIPAVKGIVESHGGTIAQQNSLYLFILLPGDKSDAAKKILMMLPGLELVGMI